MTSFDEKELIKLTKLCRIHCTDEERKQLLLHLKDVIAYVELLQELDTEGVEPCSHVLALMNVMRDDHVGKLLSREEFLANAPAHVGGMVRVPPVIKF